MKRGAGGLVSRREAAAALVLAYLRYWLTVAPRVRRALRHWHQLAESISDPVLRAQAAGKLHEERANTEAIATLCTLAPRRYRATVLHAVVALQVMYDYLDAVTEHPVTDPLRDGHQLFRAFVVALTPGEAPVDYYRHHPHRDDSGYLDALVRCARDSIAELPGLAAVAPVARQAAARFGEAQTRSHAVQVEGVEQLERWAATHATVHDLTWWEWAGGAAASILAVHALLSAAADVRTTPAQALQIDRAYLLSSTLTTMLDSLVDDERDATESEHRYIAYYPSADDAARRISAIARRAAAAAGGLPHSAHHAVTVAGVAAFYLSDRHAHTGAYRVAAERVIDELRPVIRPLLLTFRLWRRSGGARARR